MKSKSKITVFLAGTDHVKDVLNDLYKSLTRMKFKPYWFRKPDFPQIHHNAMDNCLEVVKISDRFILVIDERAGLPYNNGRTICEEEFNIAKERNIPCLVFVRQRVWQQARIYHRHLEKNNKVTKTQFKNLILDGDQDVYEFIERIQHKEIDGKPSIAWIIPFELSDEIIKSIKGKWVISGEQEVKVLNTLRASIGVKKESVIKREIPARIIISDAAMASLKSFTLDDRKRILDQINKIESQLQTGKIKSLITNRYYDKKDLRVLRIRDIRVIFRLHKDYITILDVGKRSTIYKEFKILPDVI